MQSRKSIVVLIRITILGLATCTPKPRTAITTSEEKAPLRVAIAPYQDMAWLANIKDLKLEDKYKTKIQLLTMPWEDIIPAIASAGSAADVGFASLCDYLAKEKNLNSKTNDPVIYIYTTWAFYGSGFISFNPSVPEITAKTVTNKDLLKQFFKFRIGVQKNSCNHMLLWDLARRANVKLANLPITDITFNDGLFAADNGSLDIAGSAGLLQQMEAIKRHGRVVLTLEGLEVNAPAGIICKRSTYEKRKKDINAFINMWFDCVNYVLSDIDNHSASSLAYLKANSATAYPPSIYKKSLELEYFPRSIEEANKEIISDTGKYSIKKATEIINQYLVDIGQISTPKQTPQLITVAPYK